MSDSRSEAKRKTLPTTISCGLDKIQNLHSLIDELELKLLPLLCKQEECQKDVGASGPKAVPELLDMAQTLEYRIERANTRIGSLLRDLIL